MSDFISEESLEQRLLRAFRVMIADLVINTNHIAEKLGCNPTDLQVLHLVELAGTITPKELAERTSLTSGGITVVLDRLEKENLIRREKHPTDRRSILITLNSSKRREEVDAAYKEYAENFLQRLSRYNEEEIKIILNFLEGINESNGSH